MLTYLRNLLANSGSIAKALIAVVSAVSVSLLTHSWTNVPSIISDIFAVLVYLIPNSPKVTSNVPSNPSV